MEPLAGIGSHVGFRDVVLLYPVATILHVLEEWPRFPRWARRFASPRYSDREYVVTHVATVGLAIAAAALVRMTTASWIVLGFFALVLGPGVFWNAVFHAAGTVVSRTYCAGVVTGVAVYVPLAITLGVLAEREGRIGGGALVAVFAVAAAFHALEVGHDVFKRW